MNMKIRLKEKELTKIDKKVLKEQLKDRIKKEYGLKYSNYSVNLDILQNVRYKIIKDNIDHIQFLIDRYGFIDLGNIFKSVLNEYSLIFHINKEKEELFVYDYGIWSVNHYVNPYEKEMYITKIKINNIPYYGL